MLGFETMNCFSEVLLDFFQRNSISGMYSATISNSVSTIETLSQLKHVNYSPVFILFAISNESNIQNPCKENRLYF
jgi:hypothetical protein